MERIVARIPVGGSAGRTRSLGWWSSLADPESDHITGQVYPVNGGLYM